MKNLKFNFKSIVLGKARWLLTFIAIFTLGMGQMWGGDQTGTAYNKKYLYVNSSNCSWWTDASSQPALNAYWNDEINNWAAFKEEADGELTSTSWYFDLSDMNGSYQYFRGFKIERHPKNTSDYWHTVTLAVGSGTHNCLWINSDGGGMTWGYYAAPISSISLAGSNNIISGSGTSGSPYMVLVGNTITLTATPTSTPADNTMSFCANFGTSPSASPTTVRNSSTYTVTSTSKVELKCVGRNKYGDVYSADVTSSSVWVQGVASYTLNYSIGTVAGTDGNISTSPATASGSSVQSGNNVTLTAPAAKTGYTWSGWYTNDAGTEGKIADTDRAITVTMNANKTLYACYTENDYTVTVEAGDGGSVALDEVTGHIVTTTTLPAATNSTGYHFVNWTVESGTATITNASSATTATIHGMSDDVTVKANFEEDKYIYFDNSYTKWDHVWVYLFNNDVWYNNKSGDDGPGVVPHLNRVAYAEMTLVEGEEYLYKYAYHNSSHNYSFSKIAFAKADQHNNGAFWRTEAVYRGDWNATMPIYVAPSSYTETNETKYHSDGYWMMKATTYNESVGYALRHKTGGSSSEEIGTFNAIADGSHIGAITVRYDNTNNRTYFINNISSQNYSVDHTFTSTDDGTAYDLYHYNDIVEFTITPTSVGNYTIFLEQGPEHMQISVQYPVQTGDRRLVYSFTKDASTKYRYSDVIRAAKASAVTSFYIDKDQTGAALKLQRCTGFDNAGNPTWADVSGTTGWLSTYFGTAAKGVYVMTVNFAGTNDVSSTISDIDTYSGPYYIKTDCAPGGWANYTNNALTKNTINFAADDATTFDYYMCKYISNTATNLRCVIANDYNNAISDTIKDDAILNRGGTYETLPISSSVRFSYNSTTNELKRTYLLSSNNSRFLVLKPKQAEYVYSAETSGTDYYASLQKFGDNGHWTYVLDAWVYPGAIGGVYADYPDVEPIRRQILVDPETNYLMGGTTKGDKRYHVRLVYDFKTNYLTSAWIPSGAISAPITLNSDFMLVRSGQQNAQQLSFSGTGSISEAKRAYGVFEIKKDSMTDSGLASWGPMAYRQCIYYFSFPFDVRMSDVFGAGVMGTDWRIQKYNGAKRAEKGWFGGDGTTTFWEDLTIDSIMHKNEGYCLMLNRRLFHDSSNEDIWTNEIPDHGSVYLYFPSKDLVGSVTNNNNASLKVPSHECTINRYFTQDAGYYNAETDTWDGRARNHMHTDSHWNMIGSPLFEDKTATNVEDGVVIHAGTDSTIHYIYAWNSRTNTLSIRSVLNTSFSFKAMYAYMAQYTGTITFSGASIPASVAARAMADTRNYNIELTLSKNDDFAGRAYVELSENADDNFKLNEDVYMMRNSNLADVYTFAGGYDVAANVLSVANHIIPVGVNVKSAGTYTFSMPSIFTGTVILVDTLDQTRTDLSIDDYEVDLSQGEINDRFFLEININQVVTSLENENGNNTLNDGGYHKFIRNDQMFILKNGVVYDAQGRKVE